MWRTGRRGRRPQDWSPAPRNLPMLSPYHVHQFLHSRGALLQHGHLPRQELHLVDVLDAAVLEMAQRITGVELHAELRDPRALAGIEEFSFGRLDARCGVAALEYV